MTRILRPLIRGIDRLNEVVGVCVAWLTVIMVANVFVVVFLRYVFSIGWIWMQELYVWSHATVFLLGAGYTLLHEGHVRIDLIYSNASIRYKALVNIGGTIFLAFPLLYIILDKSWPLITRSWQNLEKSAEAGGMHGVFLLKSLIAVFAILFALQFIALIFRGIEDLISGRQSHGNREPETEVEN